MEAPYSIGTIKLTYIDPENYEVLHGEMFGSIQEALNSAETKNKGNNWQAKLSVISHKVCRKS